MTALRVELASPGTSPVNAALHHLAAELNALKLSLSSVEDPATAIAAHRRFGDRIRATPSPPASKRHDSPLHHRGRGGSGRPGPDARWTIRSPRASPPR
ncbi:hypothetical protein [Micromonospora sp. NPDC001898]|uniref:hypothetical protein n=1 Tax=Micromonospora sp. NPDC001898 TaxID=3364221 RepID=UPI0036872CA9